MILLHRLCLLFALLATVSENVLASVLAIDYGADWIKASLMKPGVPFDVLLNKDSKRKIQSSVGWKQKDRLFGSDAFAIAGRYPTDSFSSLKFLQAAPYASDAVSFYTSISSADVVKTERGTVALRRSDGTEWAVEELIAMQFAYVRQLAEDVAGERVLDVVVTVPPYYTQHEREAVMDAIEIAGMRTLALVNDGTAVAVNYAMTRTFLTPEYHVIYDAGTSAIRATVVGFSSVAGDAKGSVQINVAGLGFDRTIGGTELDRRLRDIMIEDFQRKHDKDIRSDKRAMTKLWKEAGRIKTILSANADAMATVESLAFDIDYRSKVTRADFEIACTDLKGEFSRPIFDALARAGLTLNDISSVILTGGASRTPMIQAALKAAVGDSKIAMNVNADEAAVMGAALHGAALSRQFRTKDIKVIDIAPYDIQLSYPAEPKSPDVKPRMINTLVLPVGTNTGAKKTLTFKRSDDFTVKMAYKSPPAPGLPTQLMEAKLVGVSEAIRNLTEAGATDPVVKATVSFTESGLSTLSDILVHGEIKDDSITGKLKGFFGGSSSSSEEVSEGEEGVVTEEQVPLEVPAPSTSSEKKVVQDTILLDYEVGTPSLPPMSATEKRKARGRLIAVDNEEATKRRREEARNTLEGYTYRLRDLLEDNSPTSPFMKCSQEAERKRIAEQLEETFTWLSENGEDADTRDLLDKRGTLESLEHPIIHRYTEIEKFPHALNNSQLWNWQTRIFLGEARKNLTIAEDGGPPSKYTLEELEALEKTLAEHETWLDEWVEKQKSVKMNEDPVILTSEMRARVKPLQNHLERLLKKKVPRPTKKSASSSTAQASETSADAEGEETEVTQTTASSSTTSVLAGTDVPHDEL
ncbi:actin-like ATPase domain-containing protein [Laetiporus sulphureus 93-53]|uniref:Actin-like ATPase domain-containing protein n=1 Tax=Laetiporus sulphureus 93-53 TaxID=1314785 RepID=A0A165CRD5_9APHY|nr:actin-like ATPase domain-containing protein [Laetiporus sulphureus 93-53]KZT03291.1 actin-like ATPase domain-containing protein [Laetiporus sulphureus 93-53]